MKTIIKSTLLLIAVALGFTLTSCNNDPNEHETVTQQSLLNCYAVVTDLENGGTITNICTPVVIKFWLNWTTGSAEANITGLKLGDQTYPQITLENMPWGSGDDGWGNIMTKTPAVAQSPSGITPAVTDFNLRWVDRMDFTPFIGIYDPGCYFSFIIDNRYQVIGSRQPFVLAGMTKTTDPEGNVFETLKPVYSVGLDFNSGKAKIAITNARFVNDMPPMSMMFADIPFTIKDGGTRILLESASLIPSVGESPQPNFPITGLQATIVPGSGMTLNFECDYRKQVKYTVNVNVDYTNYKDAMSGI